MGKVTGFLEIDRHDRRYAPAADRIRHYKEFVLPLSEEATRDQAARCMNCGIPYCHNGCPVNNQIPDWNDLVYRGDWEEASRNLHSTNNFPEFTGRICPAPCEASCTLNLDDTPGHDQDDRDAPSSTAPGRKAGSSPRSPTQHDRQDGRGRRLGPGRASPARSSSRAPATTCTSSRRTRKPGGLLRYGIPDFKMEKHHIDRRVAQMEAEGVDLPLRRQRRRRRRRRSELLDELRRRGAGGRRREAARPADPGPRPRRRAFRHGFPAAAEPPRRPASRSRTNEPILAHRQACRGHRRRRHRLRLHRHLDPPGRAVGDAARNHAASRPRRRTSC